MSTMSTTPTVLERRYHSELRAEKRSDGSRILKGRAIVFDSLSSDLGGWRELIRPGSCTRCLQKSDLRMLRDHDSSRLLGRQSAGTLSVRETRQALEFTCTLPATQDGNDTYELVSRGDLQGCSFAMRVLRDAWTQSLDPACDPDSDEYDPDECTGEDNRVPLREVQEMNIYELSVVSFPAYADTTASVDERMALLFPTGIPTALENELRCRCSSSSKRVSRVTSRNLLERARLAQLSAERDLVSDQEKLERLKMRAMLALHGL